MARFSYGGRILNPSLDSKHSQPGKSIAERYAVDMKSVAHLAYGGGADVVVYVVESELFDPQGMRSFRFDCAGHFQVLSGAGLSPMGYAPPRSIAAQISVLACAGVKSRCDVARESGLTCN